MLGIEAIDSPYLPAIVRIKQALIDINTLSLEIKKLTGNQAYHTQLADQVESLSVELDASPYGLLDDYPAQCYPIDILPAIATVTRPASRSMEPSRTFGSVAARRCSGNSCNAPMTCPTVARLFGLLKGAIFSASSRRVMMSQGRWTFRNGSFICSAAWTTRL